MSNNERAYQNAEAEADHLAALARAEQAVIDLAAVFESQYYEHDEWAFVPLGQMQDLMSAFDAWRALGGVTTEERE